MAGWLAGCVERCSCIISHQIGNYVIRVSKLMMKVSWVTNLTMKTPLDHFLNMPHCIPKDDLSNDGSIDYHRLKWWNINSRVSAKIVIANISSGINLRNGNYLWPSLKTFITIKLAG
jgi:hypothetical protein